MWRMIMKNKSEIEQCERVKQQGVIAEMACIQKKYIQIILKTIRCYLEYLNIDVYYIQY